MKRTLITTSLVLAAVAAPAPGLAADIGHGRQLQQKNCMGCHDDSVYTRQDRKISTLDGLQKQVQRCELTLGLKWFDEDVDDVAAYLNDSYYRFP